MDINQVTLIGNVGKDPEIKTFSNGGEIANFSMAILPPLFLTGRRNIARCGTGRSTDCTMGSRRHARHLFKGRNGLRHLPVNLGETRLKWPCAA